MGKYVIKNGKILYNGYDLSGDHNQIGLTVSREEKECTTFGKAGVQRIAGLQSFDVSGSGFFEAGAGSIAAGDTAKVDTVIAPNLGTSSAELTIIPQGTSVGSKAFISEINTFEYAPGGSVGDVMGFTFAGKGEGTVLVEGTVFKAGTIDSSTNSAAVQVGAVGAGKHGYAILHVTSTTGSGDRAVTVKIQSDAAESFTTPTTQVTFTAVTTTRASQWLPTTGTITDTWWRAAWTVAGTAKNFTAYITFGVSTL